MGAIVIGVVLAGIILTAKHSMDRGERGTDVTHSVVNGIVSGVQGIGYGILWVVAFLGVTIGGILLMVMSPTFAILGLLILVVGIPFSLGILIKVATKQVRQGRVRTRS